MRLSPLDGLVQEKLIVIMIMIVPGIYYPYCFLLGKKAKPAAVSIDHDLAEGLVDLEKLQTNMASTVARLQLEFKDKISVKFQPSKSKLN